MDFSKWIEISDTPDQVKRIASSKKAECTPLSVDTEARTGVFSGSHGVYNTSLENCQCGDFTRRRLPCKHMYRLAIELGEWDSNGAVTDFKAVKSPVSSSDRKEALTKAVDLLESYPIETQDMIREIIYCSNTGRVYMCDDYTLYNDAINDGLLEARHDYVSIIKSHTQKHTLEKLEESGFSFPEDLKKTKKARYEWCLAHPEEVGKYAYPDIVTLVPAGFLDIAKKKAYTYLLRKLTNDTVINSDGEFIEIPHGSEFTISVDAMTGETQFFVSFPDDDITALLNKHGANRCLDWRI